MLYYSTPLRILKIENIHPHCRLVKITTNVSTGNPFPSSPLEDYQSIAHTVLVDEEA